MHEFAIRIGYAIIDCFTSINVSGIIDSLSIMGIGMLGIFTVTTVIIMVITLLGKIFR